MIARAKDIRTVLMIGNGRMGTDIGLQCALYGREVRYFIGLETPAEALEPIQKRQRDYLDMLIQRGYITPRVAEEALSRVSFNTDIAGICEGIDLAVEAVPETVEAKQAVWSRFAPHLPKHAILATNTTALRPSLYAENSGAPERFLAWHFATPAYIQNFVDLMPTEKTDPALISVMKEFSEEIGLNCGVLEKEIPHYITINMLFGFVDKAFELVLEGCADYRQIDKAWMSVRQVPVGPFGIVDKITLPLMRNIYAARSDQSDLTRRIMAYLDEQIADGRLGLPYGRGFYDYPNPEFEHPDFVKPARKLE